jgi:hypothetical protein
MALAAFMGNPLVTPRKRDYAGGVFYIPTLDDPGKRVLRVIQNSGVAAGWQVMSEASLTPEQLSLSAAKLMDMGLISANGNVSNAKEIGQVYFNIQPSASKIADLVLNAQ